jgi:hypothetical protein
MTPSRGEIMALHRYFLWADRMRVHLDDMMSPELGATEMFFFHPYLSYWYGGMYVVIEGWRRLGLADPRIDELLRSPNVAHLERHRHGAFHYHREYIDNKFLAMPSQPDSPAWIRDLREAFSKWFMAYFESQRDAKGETGGG